MAYTGHNRYPTGGSVHDDFDNPFALMPGKISEFARTAQGRQTMNTFFYQMLYQITQHVFLNRSVCIDR